MQFRCHDCGIAFWAEIDEDSEQIDCPECDSENCHPIEYTEVDLMKSGLCKNGYHGGCKDLKCGCDCHDHAFPHKKVK